MSDSRPATSPVLGVCEPRRALELLKPYRGEMPAGKLVLAANESPYNLPKPVCTQLKEGIDAFDFNRYPDPLAQKLRMKIGAAHGISEDRVLIGNGGDELLLDIMLAWGGAGRKMLQFSPTFTMYGIYAEALETEIITLPRDSGSFQIDLHKALDILKNQNINLCIVDNPNNPSGQAIGEHELCMLIEASDALFVVDEAYFEFSGLSMLKYLEKYPNLVILRTFSKAFSLAGLRLGYVLAQPAIIEVFAKVRMPYSVNAFTQWAGELVMDNLAEFDEGVAKIIKVRDWLYVALRDMDGVEVWQSHANYLLFRVDNAQAVWQRLLDEHDIYIRNFGNASGLRNCLRVTIGDNEQMKRFTAALRESVRFVNSPCDEMS